jgi:ribosome biogenesis GTPase
MPESGVVVRHEGRVVVVDVGGAEVACVVRKSLQREKGAKAVAVGDRVRVERDGDAAAVVAVEPRRSELLRTDPSQPRRGQVIVANLDTVVVVASVRQPDLAPALVDRFLVAAHARGLRAAIDFHKVDLDPERSYAAVAETYRALDYPVVETSVVTGEGLPALRELLAGRTATLLGHSGVGKSSLANALDPSLRLRVGAVNPETGKGTHTTTTVSLLRLPWGGYLADTPGIREFGLWGIRAVDLGRHFPEIAARADACRFRDCLHAKEPGCAVKEALEHGAIAPWRYGSYTRLLEELRSGDRGRP